MSVRSPSVTQSSSSRLVRRSRPVELRARVLHRHGELVAQDEEVAHALDLEALAVHVDVHDGTARGHRDDRRLGEKAHPRGGAVARARLGGGQRRVGVQVVVGAQDLGDIAVDDHGAVHLAELEEAVGRERDVELEAVVAGGEHVLGVTNADERSEMAGEDHVERDPEGRAGGGVPDGVLQALLALRDTRAQLGCVHGRPLRVCRPPTGRPVFSSLSIRPPRQWS